MRSLFPDDQKKHRDSGIGGLSANDALIQSERSALRSLGSDAPVAAGTPRTDVAEVFTLRKGNQDYLRGNRERPASNLRVVTVASGIAMLAAIIIPLVMMADQSSGGLSRSRNPPAFFFLMMGGIALVFLIGIIFSWRRYFFFTNNGRLTMGHLTSATGKWISTGKSRNYQVTFHYEIQTPDGRTLQGKEVHQRADLAGKGRMPVVGTPVAVLYVADGDKLYML